jgi:competence protein ComEC
LIDAGGRRQPKGDEAIAATSNSGASARAAGSAPLTFAVFERLGQVPPLYAVAVALLAGDALGGVRIHLPLAAAAALGVAAAAAFTTRRAAIGVALSLIAITVAATYPSSSLLEPRATPGTIRAFPDLSRVTIEGRVAADPEYLDDRTRLLIDVERAALEGAPLRRTSGVIRVTTLDAGEFQIGDLIRAGARLRFPRNLGNPGEFDYEAFMARRGIDATMSLARGALGTPRFEILARRGAGTAGLVEVARAHIRSFIDASLPRDEAAEMRALVIGDRSGIAPWLRDRFVRTGTVHLLSISGLHLSFVAATVFLLVRLMLVPAFALTSLGRANKIAALAAVGAALGYALLAGDRIPTVRALIMVAAYMFAIVIDRGREAVASLALAALIICIALPGSSADIGFQLSFASVLVILLGMRRYVAWTERIKRARLLPVERVPRSWVAAEWTLGYLAVSFWALLATAPLTAFHFNQFSAVGLIANPIVVPIIGLGATVSGLLAAALSFVWMPAAQGLLWFGGECLAVGNWFVEWFGGLPFAWTRVFTPTPLELAIVYALLALWLFSPLASPDAPDESAPRRQRVRAFGWRTATAAAVVAILAFDAGYWLYDRYLERDLRITFLSVGEGDAAVVRLPGGRVMIIDGGGGFGDLDMGERVVGPYLWSRKIMRVDCMVMSHPDYDHFAGLDFIAANFPLEEFWATEAASTSRSYAGLLATVAYSRARLRLITEQPHRIELAGLTIDAAVADSPAVVSRNDSSIVMRLRFGDSSFLFTGDVEARGEGLLLERSASLRSTVLKLPHHGSKSSSTPGFLEAVAPSVAVISVGYGNRFGFPAPAVLERLRERGVTVFRTDLDGAVMVDATPRALELRTYRGRGAQIDPVRAHQPDSSARVDGSGTTVGNSLAE